MCAGVRTCVYECTCVCVCVCVCVKCPFVFVRERFRFEPSGALHAKVGPRLGCILPLSAMAPMAQDSRRLMAGLA